MSDISVSFQWEKSPAHYYFLSMFLLPGTLAEVKARAEWDRILGEFPDTALERFLKIGFVIPCNLSEKLKKFLTVKELQKILRELNPDLSTSGSKEELVGRLIFYSFRLAQNSVSPYPQLYQCSSSGIEVAEGYLQSNQGDELKKIEINGQDIKKIVEFIVTAAAGGVIGDFVYDRLLELFPKKETEPINPKKETAPGYPEKNASSYHNMGDQYLNSGDYSNALEAYNEAIRLNPQNAEAYLGRGISYDRMRDYPKALEAFNDVIRLNPQNAVAYLGRGDFYLRMGDYPKALEAFNNAIRLNPQYAEAYMGQGVSYSGMGDYPKAVEANNAAIRLNPRYAEAYNNRGVAYEKMGDHLRAEKSFNEAKRLNPRLDEINDSREQPLIYRRSLLGTVKRAGWGGTGL